MREPTVSPGSASDKEQAAVAYVTKRVKARASSDVVVHELVQRGMDPALARQMVSQIRGKYAASTRKAGLGKLIAGIVITVISVALTIASYSAAVERDEGTYIICCGAILFGLVLTIGGIYQLITGREQRT